MTLDLIVKVSIVAAAGLLAAAALRRQPAALRHWLLAAALICAALIPFLARVLPSWELRSDTPGAQSDVVTAERFAGPAGTFDAREPRAVRRLADEPSRVAYSRFDAIRERADRFAMALPVFGVWFAGFLVSVALLAVALGRLWRLAARAQRLTNGPLVEATDRLRLEYGIRRAVTLLQSDHPTLLVTWGLWRPKVILPSTSRLWSTDRLLVVLSHELAHIRRHDWAVQIAAMLVRSFHWFNPIVWAACARLRQESEQACDDTVLTRGIEGGAYASHLLDIARTFAAHRNVCSPAPAIARPSSLERRVSAMLNDRLPRSPLTRASRILIAAALMSITIPLAGLALFAQAFATFSGSLVDASNAVLPNATLVLTNTARQAKYEVRSDRNGRFEFVGLAPGEYVFEARLPGFDNVTRSLTMTGRDIDEEIKLEVGTLQETITVIAEDSGPARDSLVRDITPVAPRPCTIAVPTTPGPAVGGRVRPPRKLRDVRPVYPESLRASKAQGEVKLKAIIGTDGFVKTADVISAPHPELGSAAAAAVRQWAFDSTLLNCEPIEVTMNVSVTFRAQP